MGDNESLKTSKIVRFCLEEPRYALYLSEIERVIQSMEIVPLPKAPKKILGVINVHGEVIPVIDMRSIFKLPPRDLRIDDQFILAKTKKRRIALVVDEVISVTELNNNSKAINIIKLPYTEYLSGIMIIESDVVLINDLEKFLSLDDHILLDKALMNK